MSASSSPQRRTVHMPWRGRNQEILAARHAKPQMPANWGSTLTAKPAYLGTAAPKMPERPLQYDDAAAPLHERVLRLLCSMATAKIALPASNAGLANMLDHNLVNPSASIKYALKGLDNRGAILCGYQADGRRYIVVTDTGHRVEEAR